MARSKRFQSLTLSLIFMMLALTIQDVAAQRYARGTASRGSVRYAGKTSSSGSHQTQTRRGSLDTNTSVDGNKTHRETSAEGRYGRRSLRSRLRYCLMRLTRFSTIVARTIRTKTCGRCLTRVIEEVPRFLAVSVPSMMSKTSRYLHQLPWRVSVIFPLARSS